CASAGIPPGSWISYQRTPTASRTETEWFTTSDRRPPKFRYAARNIIRSPRASSLEEPAPGCGMQALPREAMHASAKGATGSVARPPTQWISVARNGEAHVVGAGPLARVRELRDQPAVGERVVEDDPVAVAPGLASTTEAREQRPRGDGSEQSTAVFCEHGDACVDDLHEVEGPDVALRVGRYALDVECPGAGAEEAAADAAAGDCSPGK